MSETILHQRRALRRAVVRSVIIVATVAFASPFAVSAQATTKPGTHRPLLLLGGKKSGPLHEAATVGLLIPLLPPEPGSDFGSEFLAQRGVMVEATAGNSGFGLATGWGRREKLRKGPALFGEEVLATMFKTRSETIPDATYVGGEVGVTMFMFRASVGAATRVSGSEEADRTIFTWGIGFHIGR